MAGDAGEGKAAEVAGGEVSDNERLRGRDVTEARPED